MTVYLTVEQLARIAALAAGEEVAAAAAHGVKIESDSEPYSNAVVTWLGIDLEPRTVTVDFDGHLV